MPGHDLGRGRAARRGRGGPGHTAHRHRTSERRRPGTPGRCSWVGTAGHGSARTLRDALRVVAAPRRRGQCGRRHRHRARAPSRAASWSRHGSPTTWPARARASAGPASTGFPRSQTTSPGSPTGASMPASCRAWSAASARSTAAGRAGILTARSASSERAAGLRRRRARPHERRRACPHRTDHLAAVPRLRRVAPMIRIVIDPVGVRRLRLLRRAAARGHLLGRVGLPDRRRQAAAPRARRGRPPCRPGLSAPCHHAAPAQEPPAEPTAPARSPLSSGVAGLPLDT